MDSFDEMSLREALLRGIYAYGFEKPSAIQQRAIMPCIKGELTAPPPKKYLEYFLTSISHCTEGACCSKVFCAI